MYNRISREISRRGLQQVKLICKVSPKFAHEFVVSRIQLLLEWLEDLRSSEELPFDNFRMLSGPRSNLTFKSTWTRQETLRECLINLLGPSRYGGKTHLHEIVEIVNFVLSRCRVFGFREFEGPNETHGIDLL